MNLLTTLLFCLVCQGNPYEPADCSLLAFSCPPEKPHMSIPCIMACDAAYLETCEAIFAASSEAWGDVLDFLMESDAACRLLPVGEQAECFASNLRIAQDSWYNIAIAHSNEMVQAIVDFQECAEKCCFPDLTFNPKVLFKGTTLTVRSQ